MNLEENQCDAAAEELGYKGDIETITNPNAPSGCFVGHPVDNWKHTYFNKVDGTLGNTNYKSICKKGKSISHFMFYI